MVDQRAEAFNALDADGNGTLTRSELVERKDLLTAGAQRFLEEAMTEKGGSINREDYLDFTRTLFQALRPETIPTGDKKSFEVIKGSTEIGNNVVVSTKSPEERVIIENLIKNEYGAWIADRMGLKYGQNQTSTKLTIAPEPFVDKLKEFLIEKGYSAEYNRFNPLDPDYKIDVMRRPGQPDYVIDVLRVEAKR